MPMSGAVYQRHAPDPTERATYKSRKQITDGDGEGKGALRMHAGGEGKGKGKGTVRDHSTPPPQTETHIVNRRGGSINT